MDPDLTPQLLPLPPHLVHQLRKCINLISFWDTMIRPRTEVVMMQPHFLPITTKLHERVRRTQVIPPPTLGDPETQTPLPILEAHTLPFRTDIKQPLYQLTAYNHEP